MILTYYCITEKHTHTIDVSCRHVTQHYPAQVRKGDYRFRSLLQFKWICWKVRIHWNKTSLKSLSQTQCSNYKLCIFICLTWVYCSSVATVHLYCDIDCSTMNLVVGNNSSLKACLGQGFEDYCLHFVCVF